MVLSGLAGGWDEVGELLDEARETVNADAAALLLLDSSGSMLVAVASCGLNTSRDSGFRVPVGAGFALASRPQRGPSS